MKTHFQKKISFCMSWPTLFKEIKLCPKIKDRSLFVTIMETFWGEGGWDQVFPQQGNEVDN